MTGFATASTSATIDWRMHFDRLADEADALRAPGETILLWFAAEHSDFVRFNTGRIRQTGRVLQGKLSLRLVQGARQASVEQTASGDWASDRAALADSLAALREALRDAPDDPHLLFDTSSWTRTTRRSGRVPDADALAARVAEAAQGLDFVGAHAGGTIARGFASFHRQPGLARGRELQFQLVAV